MKQAFASRRKQACPFPSFAFVSLWISLVTFVVAACRLLASAVFGSDSVPLSSNRARRRSIFARVKFLSGLFAALNLLPSMATAGRRQTARFLAEFDEARTHLAERQAVVLAKVRNRL
ncbi:hypothetical protein H8A92_04485 [Bradyrhizobium sp. 10BB]|nr:hypothetical protein [Bradyrhizobium acaciae]